MNKIDPGTRLGTMILDHFAMTLVIMIFVAPGMMYDMMQLFKNPGAPPRLFMGNFYMNLLGFSLYFNKDIYLGRSIAKRFLKLQVVDVKTGMPANPLRCLVRNLTIAVWPIEVIMALINSERRLGDYLAGTKLVAYDAEQHKGNVDWTLVLIALLLAMAFVYLVCFYPIELLLEGSGLRLY
jgi:uncharacterized RDD family membrane protein YckC